MDVQKLIEITTRHILEKERLSFEGFGKTQAASPMVVLYIGSSNVGTLHERLNQQLARIWPAYRDMLPCFGVSAASGGYVEVRDTQGKVQDENEVLERINALFEQAHYFSDYNQLRVYFVLDTSMIETQAQFQETLESLQELRAFLKHPNQNATLFILMNEKLGREQISLQLKASIGEMYFGESGLLKESVKQVYLVSNQNADGGRMQDNYLWGRIIADLITLSNSSNERTCYALQQPGMRSLGFATVPKPVPQIAQVVVMETLKRFNAVFEQMPENSLSEEALQTLFEVGKEGVPAMFVGAMKNFIGALPEERQLACFPRSNSDDYYEVGAMAKADFDALTMGAWNAWLNSKVEYIEETFRKDDLRCQQCKRVYADYLKERLSVYDLVGFAKNPERVQDLLQEQGISDSHAPLLGSIEKDLYRRLFQSEYLKEMIVEAIMRLGENGRIMLEQWHRTMQSATYLVVDKDGLLLEKYYGEIVRKFFDTHLMEIKRYISTAESVDELDGYLEELCRKIVQNNQVFALSFEQELQERLKGESDLEKTNQEIYNKLTGSNLKVWFNTTGAALDQTGESLVIMKQGSELYHFLRSSLEGENVVFIDSQSGDSVDSLKFYEVQYMHLVK